MCLCICMCVHLYVPLCTRVNVYTWCVCFCVYAHMCASLSLESCPARSSLLPSLSRCSSELNQCLSQLGLHNKYHRLGGEQQTQISHSSGGWGTKIKVPGWSDSGEGPLPGLHMAASPCVLTWWREGSAVSSLTRAPALWDQVCQGHGRWWSIFLQETRLAFCVPVGGMEGGEEKAAVFPQKELCLGAKQNCDLVTLSLLSSLLR